MTTLAHYAMIKDRYCISYFGNSDEYLIQLEILLPIFERRFPGIQLFIGCKDDKVHLLQNQRVMRLSEIKQRRLEFGQMNEIRFDGRTHPIENFLKECEIDDFEIEVPQKPVTNKCVVVPRGAYPTVSLNQNQIDMLLRKARDKGYDATVDENGEHAALVMGVESVALFQAAKSGAETILVPTGVGTRLYEKFFPSGTVLHT